ERGKFRRDLWDRIGGICLRVPPLRRRAAEIEPLARAFVSESCRRSNTSEPLLSSQALTILTSYAWPGNIPQLRNVIERALVLSDDWVIRPAHLPSALIDQGAMMPFTAPTLRPPLRTELSNLERQRIIDALAQCNGNQTRAAKLLGYSRRTLTNRL